MANIYDNKNVVAIIGELYTKNRMKGMDNFQKALITFNDNYYYYGNKDFVTFNIPQLINSKKVVFRKILEVLGFTCTFNSYGDCICKYVGEKK